jgi:HK97 gp10 family phage protein
MSRVLLAIPRDVRSTVMKPALTKAAEPIRKTAQALAARETGALASSMATKTITRIETSTGVALVGPARGVFSAGKRLSKAAASAARAAGASISRPTKYAHLIEFGHRKRTKKKLVVTTKAGKRLAGGRVPPHPFMRPAFLQGAPVAEEILAAEIGKGIEKTRAALVKSGVHKA